MKKKTTGVRLPEHDLKVKSDTDHNPEMGYHFLPEQLAALRLPGP